MRRLCRRLTCHAYTHQMAMRALRPRGRDKPVASLAVSVVAEAAEIIQGDEVQAWVTRRMIWPRERGRLVSVVLYAFDGALMSWSIA